ncbi:MAG TPA: trigger factor [Urbifossiella sp.]|nr:trigger factor [Urbifossiella sp.]
MSDETNPDAPPDLDAATAAAVLDAEAPEKLKQHVEIRDAGPCKKHIKVTVEREQIDERFDERFTELTLSDQPQVRGFRPGKAPRKMIEKRYYEQVAGEVKTQVLMASLEQLAEEESISPLSPPDLNPGAITIPKEGPFIYEFDIEVRPEFDLPTYKGLRLRRPVHVYSDEEKAREKKRLLEPHGQLAPKEGDSPVVEMDDVITSDITVKFGDRELNTLTEVRSKVDKQLALADGIAEDFGSKVVGAKPGDQRTIDITLSQELNVPSLRGRVVQGIFTIKDVKAIRLPELTRELLEEEFGVSTPEAFDMLVGVLLERRLEYAQRQAARTEVLSLLADAAKWELPQDLLRRQARTTLARRVMEMRDSGMSDEQIRGKQRLLEQDVLRSTEAALKEHFVLQKVAEIEKIEIEDRDIDDEIERIADRSDESPRKVRARLEKEDLMEALATDLLERKALDLVLAEATFEDYELTPEQTAEQAGEVATVSAQAAPESSAPPEPEAAEGEAKPEGEATQA